MKLIKYLNKFTKDIEGLKAEPTFDWKKSITFEIMARDKHGIETSFERRGSGMRRLLMVAFFQYLAERGIDTNGKFIYAIEEPENYIHPRLQRELIFSFNELAKKGYQILITTHSPVFVGSTPGEDLTLVTREDGLSGVMQTPRLDLEDVAMELGVEPSDQIIGYDAIVFVEGITDIEFYNKIAKTLKESGNISADFDDKNIGFVICVGDNIKHYINRRTLKKLCQNFAVVVDSDRTKPEDEISKRKKEWKSKVESDEGYFHILRKREIENYLHINALKRKGLPESGYDEYTNMKKTFNKKIYRVINDMTTDEILEMDSYEENGRNHNELKELIQKLLSLPDQTN